MPLEDIKRDIEENARKEARRIHEESRKECELVLSDAKAKVSAIIDESQRSMKAELELLNREYASSIELGRKSAVLSAMEEALEAEMRSMRRELAKKARASPAYEKLFKDAMKAGRQMAGGDDFIVATSKKDVPLLGKTSAKVEARDMEGGLMVYSRDRSMSIDATLDKLIESKQEEIRNEINSRLFSGSAKKAAKAVKGKRAKAPAAKKAKKSAAPKKKAVKKRKK
ncbi:MAG TPA: V-type ATP synthase subunit E [Candidatus Acidoferrales bacterium]|nr:V-type ATP synthase subunit E [Candidatus Acidoferrales bacterium]